MLDYMTLIDIMANAADDLDAAMTLFEILKEKLCHHVELPDPADEFACMAYCTGIATLITAFEGFELSIKHIRGNLVQASTEGEKGRRAQ